MNETNVGLDGLHEIVSAQSVSWFPSTVSAWITILLGMCTIIGCILLFVMRWRSVAYQRAAIKELSGAQSGFEIASIIKRAALQAFPRKQVASLTGREWYDWLQRLSQGSHDVENEFCEVVKSNATPASARLKDFATACIRAMPPRGL